MPIRFKPFRDALSRIRRQAIATTELGTAALEQIPAAIRERSFFSARIMHAGILQEARDLLDTAIAGGVPAPDGSRTPGSGVNMATFRLRMKDYLDKIGYVPAEGEDGTLKDLTSDQRLEVIYRTNVEMAQGYGAYVRQQDPAALDAFPAQELYRLESRMQPRAWGQRWNNAIQSLGRENTSAMFVSDLQADSGMFALVNDPIWTAISRFGLPYPPYDFNSGMWVRDIDRLQAEELGLLPPGAPAPTPESRGLNDDLQAPIDGLAPALQEAISAFGTIIDGVFHLANGQIMNRYGHPTITCNRWVTIHGHPVLIEEDNDVDNPASSKDQASEIGKGKAAILRVISRKTDAMNAVSRGDIGPVHFYWGETGDAGNKFKGGHGISKIIAKHGEHVALRIPEVIVRGRIGKPYQSGQKRNITHGSYVATIALMKNGKSEHWVLTAFDKGIER